MNYKLLFGILIIGLLAVGCVYYSYESSSQEEQYIYQGPVRITDDKKHFRKTGETIPLEVK